MHDDGGSRVAAAAGLLFWGQLVTYLDFTVGTFDLLHDTVGWVLTIIAVDRLRKVLAPQQPAAGSVLTVAIAVAVIGALVALVESSLLASAVWVFAPLSAHGFMTGWQSEPDIAETWRFTRNLNLAAAVVGVAGIALLIAGELDEPSDLGALLPVLFIGAVVAIAGAVHYLMSAWRTKKAFDPSS